MTRTYRWGIALVAMFALVGIARAADAASIKICYTDPGADVTRVEAFAGATQLYADLVPAAIYNAGVACSTNPLPASLTRGVAQPVTIRGYNAFGEVGPASNAVTFRAPPVPPILSGITVQGVSTP